MYPINTQTPWGKADSITRYRRGISFLSTPRHGGIRVSRKLAESTIPKNHLYSCAILFNNSYWFEEDCCYLVVGLAFPGLLQNFNTEYAEKVLAKYYPHLFAPKVEVIYVA